MKIALAQMLIDSDMEKNFRKSVWYIQKATSEGAEMVCFPGIQLLPFFPQYAGKSTDSYVVNMESKYIRDICDACRENHIYGVPNFYVEENGNRYDRSLLIDDSGTIIGRQKMVHIAQCEQFYEQGYYTPSEEGFYVFDTRFGRLGIVVCFDRHYLESIRTETLRGAELIIPTANTKAEPFEMFRW